MLIDENLIESLLFQEEDTTLDFKRDQYRFVKASYDEKSELLKDILTFSNAWRRSDAFILIGVEKEQGKKGVIRGVSEHFDDADLQQFVNSKTQRPVTFNYRAVEIQGEQIGVIHIPLQKRPIYLLKDYGKLRKGEVWIRRGSSSVVADPDEVSQMGVSTVEQAQGVRLELFFAKGGRKSLGLNLNFECLALVTPKKKDLPDYSEKLMKHEVHFESVNYEYYRELVHYTKIINLVRPVTFAVINHGDAAANDVRLEIILDDPDKNIRLLDDYDLPKLPQERHSSIIRPYTVLDRPNHDSWVKRLDEKKWLIQAEVGKIQPKDTSWLHSRIYLGALTSCEIDFEAILYADNLAIPHRTRMSIKVASETRNASLEDILKLEEDRMIKDLISRGLIDSDPRKKS